MAWARYPYEGRVVLVTGAGSGIGRSIARGFLEQGATVVVLGRTASSLRTTVQDHPEDRSLVLVCDVTDRAEVGRSVADLLARFGRLDIVISNAGWCEPSDLETFDDDAWHRMHAVNVDAFIILARAVLPALKTSRGNIVAISSVSGIRGDWNQFAYNATKGALNAMVQSLALDLGDHGVRVNAVAPAFTDTQLTRQRLEDPVFAARLLDRLALDRPATPEDIARAVLFLASPDAGYITGAIIPVDGGTTASSGTPRPI
ncbi:SDR family oxidoreductase [Paeniglutamicibacter sp. ANT13_2]|uniref:SDR family oxidoreductase n=1 Tax=Paeniglutamicibacter terrestris TaxID=2723403 RepID=A0ABX1G7U2_9MICC|nr:SDR family oxidoreductase [Paeniglutamicibacter terrestris]